MENDDRVFTPQDLLPLCMETNIPLVYDVHHHRCLQDGTSVAKTTELALQTWNREPLFHLSSPLNGWKGKSVHKHHDYIDPKDFPECWMNMDITVEIEAKAKELAVLKLKKHLDSHGYTPVALSG
jgi:UV DNA damage endonuclease